MSDLNDFSRENIIVSDSIKGILPQEFLEQRDLVEIGGDSFEYSVVKAARESSGLIVLDLKINSFSISCFMENKEALISFGKNKISASLTEAIKIENTDSDWIIRVSLLEHN